MANEYDSLLAEPPVDQKSPYDALLPESVPVAPVPSGYVGRGEFAPEAAAAPIVTSQPQDPLALVAKGVFDAVGSMIPKSVEDVKRMVTLPMPVSETTSGATAQQDEELGKAWRGEYGLEKQAESIAGTAIQAAPLLHLPFSESPLRPTPRDLVLVEKFRPTLTESLFGNPDAQTPLTESLFGKEPSPIIEPSAETPTTVDEATATRQAAPVEQPSPVSEAATEYGSLISPKPTAETPPTVARTTLEGQADTGSKPVTDNGSVKTARQGLTNASNDLAKEWWQKELSEREKTAKEQRKGNGDQVVMESTITDEDRAYAVAQQYRGQAVLKLRDLGQDRPSDNAYKYGLTEENPAKLAANAQRVIASKDLHEAELPTKPTGAPPVATPVSESGLELQAPVSKEDVVAPTEAGQPESPISTKNEYTEAQRALHGFPEAEQAAKRDFGTVWDEAKTEAEKDPSIGQRLVNELNNKPREVSDTENAHLLRTEIAAQAEHSAAIEAVNSAKTPEDLTAAKSRLELARQDLQDVYDATKRAGTKSGQALASRQMLAKEDYTLAAMEARRRAANDGAPLNEKQLGEVNELHQKIADLQSQLDAHEVAQRFNTEFSRLVSETRKEARASKATTKFNDFMDRKADEARARIIERRGRLTTGFDPGMIADEAIVGASHIAKGITKFADWSVKMVDEFGDAVRPFLKDIWDKARTFHAETGKEYGEKALARYKTYLSKQTEQIQGKLEAGDFSKAERQRTQLDAEAFTMRANLQKLKNQFERGVAKEAYNKKSPAQKFWDHFVGVERAMKLSGPEVFGKLGVAAFTREALAPVESAGGYATSKLFPRLAAGTKYGADLPTVIRAEIKAKAAMFTKGMKEFAQNVAGKETELDAISGNKVRPDFWYNRIGQMHAAIKAPVKRAEFTRSLEQRMSAAIKNGENIRHPEVMTRLANEAVMDANRAIFQQNTVVSSFFSMLDKQVPVAGRTARFLFPVVKIPVNLFKELVTYHAGAPVATTKIGMAYWKGVEKLPPIQREAIIRQFTKGSIGGAALLWGYFNSDKVRKFFDNAPQWFGHTPMAMVLNEGSYLKKLQGTAPEKKEGAKELAYMAKTDIPFMYSVKSVTDALDSHNSNALTGWINNMVQSTVVPQISTQVAKAIDKPGSFPSNLPQRTNYRVPQNPIEAVKLGVPGLRETVPIKQFHTRTGKKQFSGQSIPVGKP